MDGSRCRTREVAFDQLAQRGVRARLGSRPAARLEYSCSTGAMDCLDRQAALSLARRSHDQGEDGLPLTRPLKRLAERCELRLPPDELDLCCRATDEEASEAPALDDAKPLQGEHAQGFVIRDCGRRLVTGRPDDDLAGLGELLQTCGEVDAFADDHRLAGLERSGVDEELAGLDAGSELESCFGKPRRGRPAHAGICGTQRPFSVVGMRYPCAEEREDRIANVLLDVAPVGVDGRAHLPERLTEESLHPLRTEAN